MIFIMDKLLTFKRRYNYCTKTYHILANVETNALALSSDYQSLVTYGFNDLKVANGYHAKAVNKGLKAYRHAFNSRLDPLLNAPLDNYSVSHIIYLASNYQRNAVKYAILYNDTKVKRDPAYQRFIVLIKKANSLYVLMHNINGLAVDKSIKADLTKSIDTFKSNPNVRLGTIKGVIAVKLYNYLYSMIDNAQKC